MPPYVVKGDPATGQLTIACQGGKFRAALTRNGEHVSLFLNGEEIALEQEVLRPHATFTFEVVPGEYEARVRDARGEMDASRVTVGEPGKFRFDTRTVTLLEPGQGIALADSPALKSLTVLPAFREPFRVAAKVTADYQHLCCEQTAAKIVAATLSYVGGDDGARREVEPVIIAGVRREESLHLPGRAFKCTLAIASRPVTRSWRPGIC